MSPRKQPASDPANYTMTGDCFKTIEYCEDGKYRWVYQLNMITNPAVSLVFVKMWAVMALVMFLLITGFDVMKFDVAPADILETAKMCFFFFLFLSVFSIIVSWGYQIVVLGGRYCVLFEMDDYGVVHRQLQKQFDKAQAVMLLNALIGIAAGKPGVAGSNLLAATKSQSSSDFSVVRKVKPRRIYKTILVNELAEHNQVYVPREDFDAVYQFILERCPRVKK